MYSSTILDRPSRTGCWKQVDYAESNADEGLFKLRYQSDLGISAHAVIQYVIERRAESEDDIRATAENVANVLITEGRVFRGYQSPPLPADDVYAGVKVAVDYLLSNPVDYSAEFISVEHDWPHPTLPYTALIDLVTITEEGDEESSYRVATATDLKSSWQAGGDELETLQRWGQAVNVWRSKAPVGQAPIDVIRMEIVNLRTWGRFSRELWLDNPEDVAELERWESRIGEMCQIADEVKNDDGKRPAVPGFGCLDCPWAHICVDAWPQSPSAAEMDAGYLAVLETQRKILIEVLKAGDPQTPIPIHGGEVGFREQTTRAFLKGKEGELLADWLAATAAEIPEDTRAVIVSLVAALKLGKGNLDAFAKALYPTRKKGIREVRDDYVEKMTHEVKQSRFGVWSDEHKPDPENN